MSSRSPTSPPTRTVLQIEHDLQTALLVKQVLADAADIWFAGVASTGREGIDRCRQVKPAVALLGLSLPDVDAFTVIDELAVLPEPPRVLLFTAQAAEATLFRIGRSVVNGLVWKSSDAVRELPKAFHAVLSGRTYFPATFHAAMREWRCRPDAFSKILSDRELELLPLLGRGLSDAEVAARKGISVATVHSHRQRIMGKLDLHRTAELMRWAAEKGFVHLALPAAPCCVAF